MVFVTCWFIDSLNSLKLRKTLGELTRSRGFSESVLAGLILTMIILVATKWMTLGQKQNYHC